jgi:glycosyltransferase involved in cell wall biosynthesis
VPSESSAAQVAELHPDAREKIRIVPHGVPSRFLEAQDPDAARELLRRRGVPAAPFLLHVGGTRPRKNVPLLLRAFARYRLQGGQAGLVLAGPGRAPAPPAGVLHLGYVSDDLLLALYDTAAALVISSESEGFGLPVLEAMARELPVVSTPCGGVADAAAGAALLLETNDEQELAAALLRVVGDDELRRDLVERGRVRVGEAMWERSARRLREVLAEASDRA